MVRRTFVAAFPKGRILLPDLVAANRRQLFSRSTSDHARPAISFNRQPVNASSFTMEIAVGLYFSLAASSRPKETISSDNRTGPLAHRGSGGPRGPDYEGESRVPRPSSSFLRA